MCLKYSCSAVFLIEGDFRWFRFILISASEEQKQKQSENIIRLMYCRHFKYRKMGWKTFKCVQNTLSLSYVWSSIVSDDSDLFWYPNQKSIDINKMKILYESCISNSLNTVEWVYISSRCVQNTLSRSWIWWTIVSEDSDLFWYPNQKSKYQNRVKILYVSFVFDTLNTVEWV